MKKLLAWAALGWAATVIPAHALEARRLQPQERIVLDGRLDDAPWRGAAVHDHFWDVFPEAGRDARVRTEVRVLYDKQALYVGVRAFDPDTTQLREPFARRDNVLQDQDTVALYVDPVGKRKFAQYFRVNPRGSIGDGLYNEDSGFEDPSPDFDFEVATARFEGGWSAEFRIPFASLRYTDHPGNGWTIMAVRIFPREQRYKMASGNLPREATCLLCVGEPLTGLVDLPSATHLTLTPNLTLRSVHHSDLGVASHTDRTVVPSLDVKWRPRSDVVVDATFNPDFSQVELDTPQLAGASQYALYYPEKRPFFLEGADMYEAFWRVIYTRSITDPAWGVRATQRNGQFDATVLVSRDDGGGTVLLPNTYGTDTAAQSFKSTASFARGRWQMEGVTVAGTLTDRTLDNGAYNRVGGPDIVWFPRPEHRFRVQAVGSWTTAQPIDGTLGKGALATGHAEGFDWIYHGRAWDHYLDWEEVSPAFRADNGFVNQAGYRLLYDESYRKFLGVGPFNEITPYIVTSYKTAWDNGFQASQYHVGTRFGLPRATTLSVEMRSNDKVVARRGGSVLKTDQLVLVADSNPFPWLSRLHFETALGDRVDYANSRVGRGAYVGMMVNMRPHERAEVEWRLDHDFIDARGALDGSKRVLAETSQQLLALWHFSARDSARAIVQSSTVRRSPSLWLQPVSSGDHASTVSLVYGHRRTIGTTFYVGATFGRQRDPDGAIRANQAEVFVKASWGLDVL